MKKTLIRSIAALLAMILASMALVACGAPASDPSKAEKALEENDYAVVRIDNEGLEALGLAVLSVAGIDDVETLITASNEHGEHITIIYFESKEDANDEWDDVCDYADDEEAEDGYVIKKSGNMIYYGTKTAVKAAK